MLFRSVSDVLFAVGFVTQFLADVTGPAALVLIYRVSCVLAAVALLVMAFFTAKGKRPPFLTELFPCIACVVHLLICYQLWSEVPQLMDYVMGLGAVLCLSLGAYFRLADAAGLPGKPWNNAVGLMSVYFCTVAAFAGTFNLFFTAAAIWLAGTCSGTAPVCGACCASASRAAQNSSRVLGGTTVPSGVPVSVIPACRNSDALYQ